ncbi:hypothetical protein K438DRAFT_2149714 [Mycena galopus ATCC 62051]|nr:hypothetical protein K438DRAFT_2149714 [Mycena galopus ATCC 62051]
MDHDQITARRLCRLLNFRHRHSAGRLQHARLGQQDAHSEANSRATLVVAGRKSMAWRGVVAVLKRSLCALQRTWTSANTSEYNRYILGLGANATLRSLAGCTPPSSPHRPPSRLQLALGSVTLCHSNFLLACFRARLSHDICLASVAGLLYTPSRSPRQRRYSPSTADSPPSPAVAASDTALATHPHQTAVVLSAQHGRLWGTMSSRVGKETRLHDAARSCSVRTPQSGPPIFIRSSVPPSPDTHARSTLDLPTRAGADVECREGRMSASQFASRKSTRKTTAPRGACATSTFLPGYPEFRFGRDGVYATWRDAEKGCPEVDRGRVKVVLAGLQAVQWKQRWKWNNSGSSLNEVKRRWIRGRWLKISGCSPWRKAAAKIVPTSAVRELRKDEIGRLAAPQQRQGWVPNPPRGQSPA